MAQIILLTILVEAIWETLKMTWQDNKLCIDRIGATLVSVAVTLNFQMDLFSILGISDISVIGVLATGIIISRGSNFIHDLLEKIGG